MKMNILNTCHRAAPAVLCTALLALISIVGIPRQAEGAPGRIVVGADGGFGGHVRAFTGRSLSNAASFFAYSPSFSGGVRVAVGDVNGDGAPDIIAGTGAGASHVKAFSGRDNSELRSFLPYGAAFNGGVFVAAGDVNGDGLDDIVTGADSGAFGGHVKVFDGRTGAELRSFFAYGSGFNGGVRVGAGDINNDGLADIITAAGPGATSHVKVFSGANVVEIRSFFAYGLSFTGGVFVAAGDINGDGLDDIVTGAGSGAPGGHVKVFDGQTGSAMQSFFAYESAFAGGVSVAAGDVNGDGRADILTAPGTGAIPHVKVFDGMTTQETASFLAYPVTFTGGVFIGAASVKAPRLEVRRDREKKETIQLLWPAGCVCDVEVNPDPTDPRGWSVLDLRPVEEGNQLIMLVPAVQKVRSFRLSCDVEAVR
jgi:fibronectin-binding autotransporter adhesin